MVPQSRDATRDRGEFVKPRRAVAQLVMDNVQFGLHLDDIFSLILL